LVAMEHNYREATLGLQDIDELTTRYRALFHRQRLNYAIPIAWPTYESTADPEFAIWFRDTVVDFE
jgi:hypothetical protein